MATRSRGASKRRTPPKGFRSWKTYMASIRPGAKKPKAKARTRRNPVGGSTVATKRKRRKASTAVARRRRTHRAAATTTHRRRRYRRNPPAMLKAIPAFVQSAAIGAVTATGGKITARKVRGLLKQQAGSVVGMAAEALVGIAGGLLISRFHPGIGRDFALGGIQSPLETSIQRLNIPHISDSLADDGYYLGDAYGVDVVREGGGLAGYVEGSGRSQFGDEMGAADNGARYVAGLSGY